MFEQYVNPEARPDRTASYTAGLRSYELKDHLGNVRVVVTDDRPATAANATAAYQYYAFGSPMPGRYGLANLVGQGGYRYGFQKQERDDDVLGTSGSFVDFKYRGYDTRVGRFWAVDPLTNKYPFYSPYAFSGNRVIDAFEYEGLEPVGMHHATAFGFFMSGGTKEQMAFYDAYYKGQAQAGEITVEDY